MYPVSLNTAVVTFFCCSIAQFTTSHVQPQSSIFESVLFTLKAINLFIHLSKSLYYEANSSKELCSETCESAKYDFSFIINEALHFSLKIDASKYSSHLVTTFRSKGHQTIQP